MNFKLFHLENQLTGYKETFQKHELNNPEEYISINNVTYIDAKNIAIRMLQLPNPPTAIFATTEPLAIGAMQGVRRFGYRIPEDVSIIGFDNSILSIMCYPQLSTVSQPISTVGEKVVELLIDEINNPTKTKQHIVMTTELIIRDSTLNRI